MPAVPLPDGRWIGPAAMSWLSRAAFSLSLFCLGAVQTSAVEPVNFGRDVLSILSDNCFR